MKQVIRGAAFRRVGFAIAVAAALGGCASHAPRQVGTYEPQRGWSPVPPVAAQPAPGAQAPYGVVESAERVRADAQSTGGGALLGGVIGAVVGRQFGSGGGRTAGTMVGAFGGAVIGDQIEKNQRGGGRELLRVVVRFERGQRQQFDLDASTDLRPGDRVVLQDNRLSRY